MKNIKIIVNISSYLIRKAVLSLLYENFSRTDVILMDMEKYETMTEITLKEKPDVILSENLETVFDDFVFKDIYFVGFAFEKEQATKNEFLDEILFLDDSQSIIIHKLQGIFNKVSQNHADTYKSEELSEREKDILKAVAHGLTNQEIADKLFLSIHTITTHRKNITAKLGIKTISGLTLYALLNGLVNLEETKLK